MPLWFGANEQPMYRPNTAWCTAMNASACTGDKHQEHRAEVGRQVQDEQQPSRPRR